MINETIQGQERQDAIARFKKENSVILITNTATLSESISIRKNMLKMQFM